MSRKETHILIATRGYLNDEVRVEKIVIDESEMDDDFTEFEEYAEYLLDDAAGEYEQGFSEVLIIDEAQLPQLIEKLSNLNN